MKKSSKAKAGLDVAADVILRDYRTAWLSRQASLLGRREVFSGKAKFGIFGDGKEVAQVAMAQAFRKGDVRSGYYRDQTLMMALGMCSVEQFFAQLYAHADVEAEPSSAGRSMTAHFSTRTLNPDGSWKRLVDLYNSSADVSPTGSQMPRLVGLAYASKMYRQLDGLEFLADFSTGGDEIAWGTIGNASCAEGLFWESINAIGVLQVPVVLSIWDDHYGISVPNEFQITNTEISDVLQGFQRADGDHQGFDIHRVKGWDYAALCETYRSAADTVRREHAPAIIHVTEMTQPQGHSTSGSHERYKDTERLRWELDHDCVSKMREWILSERIVDEETLTRFEEEDKQLVIEGKDRAWKAFSGPILEEREGLIDLVDEVASSSSEAETLAKVVDDLRRVQNPVRRDLMRSSHQALLVTRSESSAARGRLAAWRREHLDRNRERYGSHLHSPSAASALRVPEVPAVYEGEARTGRGFEILNRCFDAILTRHPHVVALGEDVGQLGDVNQGFSGLQEKYGDLRVTDTGIREATIVGQGIGMAMRGLRPIVEIQYLDYLLYALQIISDDLATLLYRTRGGQKAPVIIRTRGHRLEGIWHSGSPMAGILHLVRGVYVCVPRDMTRACGFYNTLLQSDDPAIVIEVLNGYRRREALPSNLSEFTMPLGVPEIIRRGGDVTIVTYGACCPIAVEAAEMLARVGIDVEVIDVQTLLPFDVNESIVESLKTTHRIVFLDEDVPGGATAFMMQQVLEVQGGYRWLDSSPRSISARAHRPAYGSDGDYFSKPNREDVFDTVYDLMREADPARFPQFD